VTVTAPWPSNPTRMALVVVDVQNDFADPSGSLYVDGGEQVVHRVNEEIAAARGSDALVVYTQDWHPESTPHFAKDGGVWPTHCVQETWGARFHPQLRVEGPVVQKGTGGEDGYSGFSQRPPQGGQQEDTGLDALLKQHHIEDLVVVGLAQDVCVRETVLDGLRLGYRVCVPVEATRPAELQPGDGQAALEAMAEAGAELLRP
jgi:nicotinamidase/pyrazinamidase